MHIHQNPKVMCKTIDKEKVKIEEQKVEPVSEEAKKLAAETQDEQTLVVEQVVDKPDTTVQAIGQVPVPGPGTGKGKGTVVKK